VECAVVKAADCHFSFHQFPEGDLQDIVVGRALILAPHPDDESLGCGGLIAASCAAGNPPVLAVLTDGAASHPGSKAWPPERLRALREAETLEAGAILGLRPDHVHFMRRQDTLLPTSGRGFFDLIHELRDLAMREGCSTVIAPWLHDPHCDHEAAWLIAVALSQDMGIALRAYPVWGWTLDPEQELAMNSVEGWSLDISAYTASKTQAIRAHRTQLGQVITDDPGGFVLAPRFIAYFTSPREVYLRS